MTTPILFLLPSSSTFSSVCCYTCYHDTTLLVLIMSLVLLLVPVSYNHRIPTTCTITTFCSIVLSSAGGCLQAKKNCELIADSIEPRLRKAWKNHFVLGTTICFLLPKHGWASGNTRAAGVAGIVGVWPWKMKRYLNTICMLNGKNRWTTNYLQRNCLVKGYVFLPLNRGIFTATQTLQVFGATSFSDDEVWMGSSWSHGGS